MDFRSMLPLRPRPPEAYDPKKATEIAAFFVLKEGGSADILKLAKLLYLAERESFRRYGEPLTHDRLCSMPDGPVLSETLNYIRGQGRAPREWDRTFAPREGNTIRLRAEAISEDSLLRLSDADVDLLNDVWRSFGHMDPHEIWVYVHSALPEYEDPGTSSRPIKVESLLQALQYSSEQIAEILGRLQQENEFHAALKKAAI